MPPKLFLIDKLFEQNHIEMVCKKNKLFHNFTFLLSRRDKKVSDWSLIDVF